MKNLPGVSCHPGNRLAAAKRVLRQPLRNHVMALTRELILIFLRGTTCFTHDDSY